LYPIREFTDAVRVGAGIARSCAQSFTGDYPSPMWVPEILATSFPEILAT
jgi:hypothetical protein